MSLVVIANKENSQEQFGRFIDDLVSIIASHNSRIEEEGKSASGTQNVDLSSFLKKAKELLAADKLYELLQHLLTIKSLIISDSKTAVSSFYILGLLISKITDKNNQINAVRELVKAVNSEKDTEVSAGTKFKLLTILFNSFGNENSIRYEIFLSILNLALELNRPTVVLAHLETIDEHVAPWNLNKEQEGKLLKLAAKLVSKCDDKLYREKYNFYSRYLRLLNNKFDDQSFKDNADDIKILIKTALNYFPYEIDISSLLDLKPIQEFAKTDKVLFDLFTTAVEGNLTTFDAWKKTNGAFLSANKIDEERVLDRVRLKSIFQEVQKSKILKLKDVEKLLNLSEDEVEFWIIKVHQEGHLRGKIDQLEGTLYIDGIIDDSFKSSEWKDLEVKLNQFKDSYEGFIEKLKTEKTR